MIHNVLCKNYKECVYIAEKFAKLYSDKPVQYKGLITSVQAGDDTFHFRSVKGKISDKNIIGVDTFVKKYLTQKSQTV